MVNFEFLRMADLTFLKLNFRTLITPEMFIDRPYFEVGVTRGGLSDHCYFVFLGIYSNRKVLVNGLHVVHWVFF